MADYDPYHNPYNNGNGGSNPHNNGSSGNQNNNQYRPPDRSINVTQPRQASSIDASRVSAYTMREQQALERLKRTVGNPNQHENRMSHLKTIIAIILILLLLALAIVFIVLIGKADPNKIIQYDIRISMQIENKSVLSVLTSDGREQLREINPGDTVPLRASIRNANEFYGDENTDDGTPPPIFVRFRLVLVLDYEERYDILKPTMNKNIWYSYDYDDPRCDHYYYYAGTVYFQQSQELFSAITFDGETLVCEDGGKYGQIQVMVESIEANINSIMSEGIWQTAPTEWRNIMYNLEY